MKQNKGQKETEEKKQVLVQAPLGMNDILPAEQKYWNFAIGQMEDLAKYFGYKKIVTPIIEYQDLFTRSIGRVTDIVEKEIIKSSEQAREVLRNINIDSVHTELFIQLINKLTIRNE